MTVVAVALTETLGMVEMGWTAMDTYGEVVAVTGKVMEADGNAKEAAVKTTEAAMTERGKAAVADAEVLANLVTEVTVMQQGMEVALTEQATEAAEWVMKTAAATVWVVEARVVEVAVALAGAETALVVWGMGVAGAELTEALGMVEVRWTAMETYGSADDEVVVAVTGKAVMEKMMEAVVTERGMKAAVADAVVLAELVMKVTEMQQGMEVALTEQVMEAAT